MKLQEGTLKLTNTQAPLQHQFPNPNGSYYTYENQWCNILIILAIGSKILHINQAIAIKTTRITQEWQ